jgi:hypothetical protein
MEETKSVGGWVKRENKQIHRKECKGSLRDRNEGNMRGGAHRSTRLRVPCALTAHVTEQLAAVSAG